MLKPVDSNKLEKIIGGKAWPDEEPELPQKPSNIPKLPEIPRPWRPKSGKKPWIP